jgi:uncharacterized protein (DUF433 family)
VSDDRTRSRQLELGKARGIGDRLSFVSEGKGQRFESLGRASSETLLPPSAADFALGITVTPRFEERAPGSLHFSTWDCARVDLVVVDARSAAIAVRSGLVQLTKARRIVSRAPDVLGGTPLVKGTRIPVHDIAEMLTNGDAPAAIVRAYPQLDKDRVRLAAVYALAYPRRGRPLTKPARGSRRAKASETLAYDGLPRA